jgi:hypothetical protein
MSCEIIVAAQLLAPENHCGSESRLHPVFAQMPGRNDVRPICVHRRRMNSEFILIRVHLW